MDETDIHAMTATPGAGFKIRAIARGVDVLYAWVLQFVAVIIGGTVLEVMTLSGKIPPGWQQRSTGPSVTGVVLVLAGSLLYHTLCEWTSGATLGKQICGLRVIAQDGGSCSIRGATIRNLSWYIDSLFFGMVGYDAMGKSPQKQRYGDKWGRTMVARCGDLSPQSKKSAGRFVLGLLVCSFVWCWALAWGVILKGQ